MSSIREVQADRFSVLFESTNTPMAVVVDDTLEIVESNSALGSALKALVLEGKKLTDFMHPEDAHRLAGKPLDHPLPGPFRFLTPDASIVWLALSVSPAAEKGQSYVVAHDVTEGKEREEELFRRAHYDPVTGLPNRHLFEDRVRQGLAAAERENRKSALLFMDLDRFKSINDTHGHAVGDAALKVVASRLLHGVRGVDTVCRYAGDEFIVFLAMLKDTEDTTVISDRLNDSVRETIVIGDVEVEVGASFGSAVFPDDASDIDDLLTLADERMYRHKNHNRR